MKIDSGIGGLDTAADAAAALERRGYDGVMSAETSHDPFLPLLLAAQSTERVDLMTSIAVAFARSPMTLAQTAWDLQATSDGRFVLGLGSQIKPHITRRFSMPWSHPAARMREMILAIRAIWACWNDGTKLDFRGDFYTHTLMTPFFNPGPNPHGDARIFLAGVGELMTEVAGEVADGFICHGFTTRRYLDEVTLPHLEKGRAKAGKTMDGFELIGPDVRGDRPRRGRDGAERPTACAGRSRSTARRRPTARCSSCTAGATCRTTSTACPRRAAGTRWASSIDRRDPRRVRGGGSARRGGRRAHVPLGRRPRPDQLLRPVRVRERSVGQVIADLKAA